ncbi:signal peptidase II [Sandaracinus amylolyticus]|uniref:signal peptidase II n=1 Tax=Sandaracinus amylolyticus TaxID=927083 RepID=UPI001F00AA6D|nr:signal peptidase II [Sandaracinus amylolyticus]UJR80735.1 Lipoprotein signal peptidase [Sandaracinus amylolyticus]
MTPSLRARVVAATLFLTTAGLGSGCDLTTKHWAEETLRDVPGQTLSVIAPHLDFTLRFNEGTAFSVVRDLGVGRAVLGVLALIVAAALLVVVIRSPESRMRTLALGLVAGGAIGNGLDRITRSGVVDFVEIHYPWGGSWPAFNVADVLVAVGAALLILDGWRAARADQSAGASGIG